MEHLFLMFLDHTQRRSTVGRTPLDEWSARRRDLYLTTPRSQQASGLLPLTCWDLEFKSHRGHGYLSVASCVVRQRSLRRADHSSRGVPPTVLRRCVWSKNIKNRCSIYIYDISSLRVNNIKQNHSEPVNESRSDLPFVETISSLQSSHNAPGPFP